MVDSQSKFRMFLFPAFACFIMTASKIVKFPSPTLIVLLLPATKKSELVALCVALTLSKRTLWNCLSKNGDTVNKGCQMPLNNDVKCFL